MVRTYNVGDLVLIAYEKAFQNMKWPEFTTKFYGP